VISFDAALGIFDDALAMHSHRSEILANNIVNADTPNYQARDVDFEDVLASMVGRSDNLTMTATNVRHVRTGGDVSNVTASELKYRMPLQPSIDGNTVDLQIEQAEFAKNALRFQASYTFLNSKLRGLTSAIRGE